MRSLSTSRAVADGLVADQLDGFAQGVLEVVGDREGVSGGCSHPSCRAGSCLRSGNEARRGAADAAVACSVGVFAAAQNCRRSRKRSRRLWVHLPRSISSTWPGATKEYYPAGRMAHRRRCCRVMMSLPGFLQDRSSGGGASPWNCITVRAKRERVFVVAQRDRRRPAPEAERYRADDAPAPTHSTGIYVARLFRWQRMSGPACTS